MSSDPKHLEPTVKVPDPGNRTSAMVAWGCIVVLLAAVVFLQQRERPSATPAPVQASSTEATAEVTPPAKDDSLLLQSKAMVKLIHYAKMDPSLVGMLVSVSGQPSEREVDNVREVMVEVDLLGPKEGPKMGLEKLGGMKSLTGELAEDAAILQRAYQGDGSIAGEADRQRLIAHHGWFGELAATQGLPDTDPARAAVVGGGEKLAAKAGVFGLVVVIAVVGGIGSFIWFGVLILTGRLRRRFVPPAPGGSVYLEVLPVLMGAFLVLKLAVLLMDKLTLQPDGSTPQWVFATQLAGQWLLVLVPLWPLMRGVRWAELRRSIGWSSERSVIREIGCGIAGYFACLPLYFAASFVVAIYVLHQVKEGHPTPKNPVMEMVSGASPLALVLLAALATAWAPIVEEAVFRGAFFRHLRSRMGVLSAAIVSALAFGLMHGYPGILLLPVIALGFAFALMREWRGSIVCTMTAHFLHNSTVLGLVLMGIGLTKDL